LRTDGPSSFSSLATSVPGCWSSSLLRQLHRNKRVSHAPIGHVTAASPWPRQQWLSSNATKCALVHKVEAQRDERASRHRRAANQRMPVLPDNSSTLGESAYWTDKSSHPSCPAIRSPPLLCFGTDVDPYCSPVPNFELENKAMAAAAFGYEVDVDVDVTSTVFPCAALGQ
jgi:hypothetical protein